MLHEHVVKIASQAPADQLERYNAAAESFRMPYWDWALGEKGGPVPDFFTTETITVKKTDGTEESIFNPLYTYSFHPLNPADFDEKVKHEGQP